MTITSSYVGTTTTYVVTDAGGNTATITALAPPGGLSFASSANPLLIDGQVQFHTLAQMLTTGLRPLVITGTVASFTN